MVLVLVAALASCKSGDSRSSESGDTAHEPAPALTVKLPTVSGPAPAPGDPLVTAAVLTRFVAAHRAEHYFGLYMMGDKVGWARVQLRPTIGGEPGGYATNVFLGMKVHDLDRTADAEFDETRYYAAAPPYGLVRVESIERSPDGSVGRSVTLKEGELMQRDSADDSGQIIGAVPASAETLAGVVAGWALDPRSVVVGQTATYADFDIESGEDEMTRYQVVALERERVSGVETPIATVSGVITADDVEMITKFAAGGVPLTTSIGASMVIKLEEKQVAQSDVVGLDVLAGAIAVKKKLGAPGEVVRLEMIVEVADGYELPSGPNQQVKRRADGRYDVVIRSTPGRQASVSERSAALEKDSRVDVSHPSISALAEEIARGSDGDADKVARIQSWVYDNLDKTLSTNLSRASSVLEKKVGDCTEHALLFVALARAAGVPAREASGITYMGDEFMQFGQHAWAEVILDGRWVSVDPSWDETIANATHLKLGDEEKDSHVMTMGALRVEIVGVRHR